MANYFVYILVNHSLDRLYIGQTKDMNERLDRHNKGYVRSTKNHRPWKVLFCKNFPSRSEAVVAERKLKNLKSRRRTLNWIVKEMEKTQAVTPELQALLDKL